MKIIFLADMGKSIGGGGYATYRFAEELALLGHTIKIFGLSRENKLLEGKKLPENISLSDRMYVRRTWKGAGRFDDFLDYVYTMTSVRDFVMKENYDFICGSLRTAAINAAMLARQGRIKSVNFVYETPLWMEHDLGERWFREYKGRFRKSWEKTRQAYLDSDILISNSLLSQRWCEKWLASKKVDGFVYPGISLEEINASEGTHEKNRIVYAGRLNAYKNIDVIIRALSLIKKAPGLDVIGEGEEHRNLRKLASSMDVDCTFHGRVPDETKWRLINESMFMVFPSSHEGFGMPPMEALACRKPCICSDKEIFREVYEDKVEYFRENDPGMLAKKIRELASDKAYRNRRGEEGRAFVGKKFSWKKSAKKIELMLSAKLGHK